ncbi:MAG TPA: hypothetical protein VJN48_00990 [Terriglobales bacterium]|nr:hypothetical protein [Terriglobales bacterium]
MKAALIVVLLPLILLALLLFVLHRAILYVLVWLVWLPKGKDILFVYSNSPIWQEYMTEQVLPLVEDRAVVLNWSERSRWRKWRLTQQVFYSFGGHREFNPLVVLFRPFRRARLFRFWSAFKDWKHGHTERLEVLKNDLQISL